LQTCWKRGGLARQRERSFILEPAPASERDALPETAAKRGESAGAKPAPFVVVLGMHRSGTSLCSHILGRLGSRWPINRTSSPQCKRAVERPEIVDRHDAS